MATKRGFLGKFSLELEWWYKVQTTKESLQRRRKKSYIQTLSNESWDSTELVLGHWSWDIGLGPLVLGR